MANDGWVDIKPANDGWVDVPVSEWRGDTSGRSVKDMQREFILKEGGFRDVAKQRIKDAVPYIRPTVEGLGAILGGGLAGTAGGMASFGTGAVPAAIIGSGLGYASGKNIMDTLEGNWAQTPQEAATRMVSDVGTGAMFEMGGQAAGKLITKGIQAAPAIKRMVSHPIQTVAENRALRAIEANAPLTAEQTANAAKSREIARRLGIKLTPGQMSGNPTQTVLEGNLASHDPAFKAMLDAQDSAAKQAGLDRIRQQIGGAKPVPLTQDAQTIGGNINAAIDAAEAPVRAAEAQAWGRVPQYEIPTHNTDAAFKEVMAIPSTAQDAVAKIKGIYAAMPKNTAGLQTIEREINSAMQAGTQTEKRALSQLKTAINEDFNAMGNAAAEGNIALHNGKVVYPAQIQAEIDALQTQIQGAAQQAAPLQAQNKALFEYLASKGEIVSQNTGISDAQYAKSLADRLTYLRNRGIGADFQPPTVAGNQEVIANWQQGIAQKQNILENLQPADNVAEAYGAAKSASLKRFEQFDRGATKKVQANGNEYDGSRITDENTARQFFTETGADDLIRAVGPEAATQHMRPFVIKDMTDAAAKNGEVFNLQTGLQYIQKNKTQLEKFGLMNDARQLLKSQFPAEMERTLAKNAADSSGKQFFTPKQMRDALVKYSRTIKSLYGDETLAAFRENNELLNTLDRSKLTSRTGNSTTNDKAVNMANSLIKAAEGPAVGLTDGLAMAVGAGATAGGGAGLLSGHGIGTAIIGGTMGGGGMLFKNANKQAAQTFVKIMQDSVMNPQTAKSLADLRRTGQVPLYLQTIINRHIPTGTAAGLLSGGE